MEHEGESSPGSGSADAYSCSGTLRRRSLPQGGAVPQQGRPHAAPPNAAGCRPYRVAVRWTPSGQVKQALHCTFRATVASVIVRVRGFSAMRPRAVTRRAPQGIGRRPNARRSVVLATIASHG